MADIEKLRKEMGITPPLGRAKGVPTYLMHLAFRLNENEARTFLKAASEMGLSESLYARLAILEKVNKGGK